MNTELIGLGCITLGTSLDSILPIVFQESDIEIFSYLLLISIVFIILSLTHLSIFNKAKLEDIITIVRQKSIDVNIVFYGIIRYIKYWLFTFGALNIKTGLYNALIPLQVIFLTISNNRDIGKGMTSIESVGIIIMVCSILFIIYNNCVKNNKIDKMVVYGTIAIVIALLLDIKDDTGFSKIADNPYQDIAMSSVVMLAISILVIGFRYFFMNKKFAIEHGMKLLYLIAVPIILIEYIPTILEFASYDYLPIYIILCFFLIQSVLGFGLDYFYYKTKFSMFNLGILIGLLIGGVTTIYGFYQTKYGKGVISAKNAIMTTTPIPTQTSK